MIKFYEVPYEGVESSFYVVFGSTLGLFLKGKMYRTIMTLDDCEKLVLSGHAIAYV